MEKNNNDNENKEYTSVDGEIWGKIEDVENANQAWYDATFLNEEEEETKPKTR